MKLKIPETITEDELAKIAKAARDDKDRAAYIISYYEALRVSEIVNLEQDNIKREQHLIQIKEAKGMKDRHIPIVKPLKLSEDAVLKALKQIPIGKGVRALQTSFKKKAKEVLNKDLHFHCLRHSGATWLLNKKKWDIRQVQQFLGHSKLATTEIYTHVTPSDLIALEWGESD